MCKKSCLVCMEPQLLSHTATHTHTHTHFLTLSLSPSPHTHMQWVKTVNPVMMNFPSRTMRMMTVWSPRLLWTIMSHWWAFTPLPVFPLFTHILPSLLIHIAPPSSILPYSTYLPTVDREIFVVKIFLSITSTMKIKQAKYFLQRIIRVSLFTRVRTCQQV